MMRKTIVLAAVFGLAAALFAAALLFRPSASAGPFGPLNAFFARPRPATPSEQRELLRLSLEDVLKRADPAPSSSNTPRIALSLVPYRPCLPIPSTQRCEPNAHGMTLMSEDPPAGSKRIKRVPIKLRKALVRTMPPAPRLPDPVLPQVFAFDDSRKLSDEETHLTLGLFRGEVPSGVGYASMSWAVVSADGKTALMDMHLVPGGMTLELFRREKIGWRRIQRLRY